MLLHLPAMVGHAPGARVKNGPALVGHGAQAARDAIAAKIETLPEKLRKSLTWDQGAEIAQHAQLRLETGLTIYFCDPRSPWQRGTNENTNGLLRQYFPKGTVMSRHGERKLDAVATALNGRPRKILGWKTPAEALNAPTIRSSTNWCFDDSLNPSSTSRSATASDWPRPASSPRSAARATATTTRCPRQSTGSTSPRSFTAAHPGDFGSRGTGNPRMGVLVQPPPTRLLEPIGYIPPAEAEANYYRQLAEQTEKHGLT